MNSSTSANDGSHQKGVEPAKAMEDAKGHYGRFEEAASYIDPRQQ